MKRFSGALIATSVAISGLITASPLPAQKAKEQKQEASAPRKFSKGALKALGELQKVVNTKNDAAYPAALAAAEAVASNSDDRYAIGQMRLNHAINTNDEPGQLAAIQALIASGGARPSDLKPLYTGLFGLSYNANHIDDAAAALEKLSELEPNSTDTLWKLAEVRAQQKRYPEAIAHAERAIAIAKTNNQPVPENWYKRALQFARVGKLSAQTAQLVHEFLTSYSAPGNWRDALLIYRQELGQNLDVAAQLDLWRLVRSANALSEEGDYYALASLLARANFPAEAQKVVDEAVANGKVKASKQSFDDISSIVKPKIAEDKAALPALQTRAKAETTGRLALKVADGYYGHGEYAKAAELYRLALQQGSVDTGLANIRLGMSLAMAGQKAEAEVAFKAVTGPRQDLAGFWLLWLSQHS